MAQYKDGSYIVKDGKIYEVQIDIPRMMGAEVIHVALKDFKKQTNGDRIRHMSDEELAEWMNDGWLDVAISKSMVSTEQWLDWLRKDAD